jgi:molybdate transport system substrate-binding protein
MAVRRTFSGSVAAAGVLLGLVSPAKSQKRPDPPSPAIVLYGAGSLQAAISEIAEDYQKRTSIRIEATFGPSGLLRERIEHGERPDIFASADLASPRKLADQGLGSPVKTFTANAVCAVARPGLAVSESTLLRVMLDPGVKIGAATPVADPLGDYTEAVFDNAEHLHPGARKILDTKALRLVGGRDAPRVPAGQESTKYFLMEGKQADLMLTYCSGAQAAVRAEPKLQVLRLPANLSMAASFGYTVLVGSKPGAADFGRFLESEAAQGIFLKNGFLKSQP